MSSPGTSGFGIDVDGSYGLDQHGTDIDLRRPLLWTAPGNSPTLWGLGPRLTKGRRS